MNWVKRIYLVLLWVLFVWFWYRVYGITTTLDVTNAMLYLSVTILVYAMIVTLWIFHNLAIYRKKGPRTDVRLLSFGAIHDALRQYIVTATDVQREQSIAVDVVDGRKIFSESSGAPSA